MKASQVSVRSSIGVGDSATSMKQIILQAQWTEYLSRAGVENTNIQPKIIHEDSLTHQKGEAVYLISQHNHPGMLLRITALA